MSEPTTPTGKRLLMGMTPTYAIAQRADICRIEAVRHAARTIALAFAIVLTGQSAVEAAYTENVRQARQWLRARTSDRAFRCAHILWDRESGWRPRAGEPWGAYGIPQAYPGTKMRSAGADWRWNATTQVRWGRGYVRSRYGSFCQALNFQSRYGWY